MADFDNDGDRDLFIACGHIDDNVELYNDTTRYMARNILLRTTARGNSPMSRTPAAMGWR